MYILKKFFTFTSAVFYYDVWLTMFLGILLSCICCGVIFFNHASDTDSWIRSFNLVWIIPSLALLEKVLRPSFQISGSLLNRDTSFEFVPYLHASGKVFSFTLLIGGYLLFSCYCAVLISHLAVSKFDMPFEDLEGFINSDYRLAQNDGANMEYLKHALNPSSE